MANNTFEYNGETFFIDKLSSFTDLYLKKEFFDYDQFICKLGFEFNFSGSKLKVEKLIIIPHYQWDKTYSKFLCFFKVKNMIKVPAYEKAINSNQIFTYENYKNKFGKDFEDFNKDFMKWVAEELDIKNEYDWIMKERNIIKKYIEPTLETKQS